MNTVNYYFGSYLVNYRTLSYPIMFEGTHFTPASTNGLPTSVDARKLMKLMMESVPLPDGSQIDSTSGNQTPATPQDPKKICAPGIYRAKYPVETWAKNVIASHHHDPFGVALLISESQILNIGSYLLHDPFGVARCLSVREMREVIALSGSESHELLCTM
jgi:hypothetical protein